MTTIVGLVHSGDSIAGSNSAPAGPSYFLQAYGWTGIGDSTTPVTQKRATYYNGNIIGRNMAISGSRLNTNGYPDLVPMALIDIDPIIPVGFAVPPNDRARKYIFTCAIGSNDAAVGGFANFTLYASAVAACCVLRRTAGFNKLGLCTLLPRNDGIMSEPNRTGYNSLITGAGWAATNGIDFIIDLASETTMGNPASCSNSTWYCQNGVNGYTGISGLHPTSAGHALLAPIYATAVNTIVAGL